MFRTFVFISVFLMLANFKLSSQVLSDTIQIHEFVVSDKKILKKHLSGMTVTNIDSIIIIDKINSNLSNLLSENTTVFINSYANGSMATASFRGTAATHTQVQWNGMNINSPMLGMVDFSLIPVYLIDELTLYHGNSSLSQTSGGLGGAIILNNKANWENKLNLQYSQGIGSFHTDNEYFKMEIGNKKFQSKTRIYRVHSENDFYFINKTIGNIDSISGKITNPRDTNNSSAYKIYGLLQEFYTKINDNNILSLYYWGQNINRNIPRISSYEGNSQSCKNKQTDNSHKIIISWNKSLKRGYLSVKEGFEHSKMFYTMENIVAGTNPFPVIYSKSNCNQWFQTFNLNKTFSNIFDYDLNIIHTYQNVETIDTVNKTGYNVNRHDLSIKNTFSHIFFNKIFINVLIRSEIYGKKTIPLIPFFGINYNPFDEKLTIGANISRNYHFPTLNDLYWQPGGNENLLPENGFGYEFSANYKFDKSNFSINPRVSLYQSKINDWIIWLPSARGYWEPTNIRKVFTKGIEIGLNSTLQINRWKFNIVANYSFGESLNLGDTNIWGNKAYNQQLPFVPKHSGNVLFSANWKFLHISYQHNSYSKRYITNSSSIGTRQTMYPYFMNNLSIGYDQNFGNISIEMEFKIQNLLNEVYHSMLLQPMPKINFMIQATLKYQIR